ncbi:MAG: hypothetical protein ABJG68_11695 [Crocinitomicaceae bacterium]
MPFKECFIQDDTCVEKFKQAHILSQAATMKLVQGETKAGQHVVHLGNTNEQGVYEPISIGWKKASAYHCFCHDHDNDLFVPIENDNELDPKNKEQLFLHVMRSFAYVYYRKKEQMQTQEELIDVFNSIGDSLDQLRDLMAKFIVLPPNKLADEDEMRKRMSMSYWSFKYVKNELLKSLKSNDFDRLEYRSLIIPERLPFASAGVLLAKIVDPNPNKIMMVSMNPGDPVVKPPALMFNVLPDKFDRTIIVAAAIKDDHNATYLLRKFDKLEKGNLGRALTRLLFDANQDNTFLHPKFWEYLKENGYSEQIIKELNEDRGFDLMSDPLKLSELNLFSPEFYCKSVGIV